MIIGRSVYYVRRLLGRVHPSDEWSRLSYAQEGEDLVLARELGARPAGFYVDVGAHHPFRFSNTYLLYRRGWRGICVDPLPGTQKLFSRWRPRDLVLELGVSSTESTLKYYMFNEPALNTFDATVAREKDGLADYRVTSTADVEVVPLATLLDRHMPPGVAIDVLSIDVEGLDLVVLESNDWIKYRPNLIVAECLGTSLMTISDDPITVFLSREGYEPFAKTGGSVVFRRVSPSTRTSGPATLGIA